MLTTLRSPAKWVAAIAALLAVGWFFGLCVATKGLFSQETAAWVQGVGSVAAILAAILISNADARRQEVAAFNRDIGRVSVAAFLSHNLQEAMEAAMADKDQETPEFDYENFDSIIKALEDDVLLADLPSPKIAISMLNQRRAAFFFRRALKHWSEIATRARHGFEESESKALKLFTDNHDPIAYQQERLAAATGQLLKLQGSSATSHAEIDVEIGKLLEMGPRGYAR